MKKVGVSAHSGLHSQWGDNRPQPESVNVEPSDDGHSVWVEVRTEYGYAFAKVLPDDARSLAVGLIEAAAEVEAPNRAVHLYCDEVGYVHDHSWGRPDEGDTPPTEALVWDGIAADDEDPLGG